VLRPSDNPLEHMIRLARELGRMPQPSREQDLRNFLGTFNFSGDMVKQAVGTMSGGEKARLVLAMIVWQRPNLLLLDEPTNHLDLATREALAMALNDFDGTVMLVSHDRHLLRAVCEDFWMVGRGVVGPSTATWTTTSATCWKNPSACAKKPSMPKPRRSRQLRHRFQPLPWWLRWQHLWKSPRHHLRRLRRKATSGSSASWLPPRASSCRKRPSLSRKSWSRSTRKCPS
jgi:energy-coupling factor transporter ATP-binding protein EcfA2